MKIAKITLPIAIIISAVILAIGLYTIQYNKEQSIERQTTAKIEEAKEAEAFNRNIQCQSLLSDLHKRFNNVVSIYYSQLFNDCQVVYMENGEENTSSIGDFGSR